MRAGEAGWPGGASASATGRGGDQRDSPSSLNRQCAIVRSILDEVEHRLRAGTGAGAAPVAQLLEELSRLEVEVRMAVGVDESSRDVLIDGT